MTQRETWKPYRNTQPENLNFFRTENITEAVAQAIAECEDLEICSVRIAVYRGEMQVVVETSYDCFRNRVRGEGISVYVSNFGDKDQFSVEYSNYKLVSRRDRRPAMIVSDDLPG